ncbi:hypothetical protein SAMN02745166_00328 [Prosthecobacter debontii]|uniref:Uncharacterized protein n=1 Tax=Prosthecobacter debontii TaxID=48467 RepID=A0A1T4WKJ2_9BACT|nr:hypothetical protein [Prosthecobacter debontii]SKA77161.1 hypothetical protein SAMN02745166_00328 [Prosthecobacter debontii]
MINWIKKKKEESFLRKWLKLALNDPIIKQILKVDKAVFSIADPVSILSIEKPGKMLLGQYSGDWPKIKGASPDCLFNIGKLANSIVEEGVTISAVIVSKRVIGFLFTPIANSFYNLTKLVCFYPSNEATLLSSGSVSIPKNFPSWLPEEDWTPGEVDNNYYLPGKYENADICELFRWFHTLHHQEYLLTRPGIEDEIQLHNANFLTIGQDDCGNLLALSSSSSSNLVLINHSSLKAITIDGGIRVFLTKNNFQ